MWTAQWLNGRRPRHHSVWRDCVIDFSSWALAASQKLSNNPLGEPWTRASVERPYNETSKTMTPEAACWSASAARHVDQRHKSTTLGRHRKLAKICRMLGVIYTYERVWTSSLQQFYSVIVRAILRYSGRCYPWNMVRSQNSLFSTLWWLAQQRRHLHCVSKKRHWCSTL